MRPTITSISSDSGTVGNEVTNATHLTLAGMAQPGSTVKVYDGGSQIGTATANASGAWSFTTAPLSNATHNFTATATDATGNTGSASSPLTVKVDAARAFPLSSTPKGHRPLVKGSFEAMSVRAGETTGFHQAVQTAAGQNAATTMKIAYNDSIVLLFLILGALFRIRRSRLRSSRHWWHRTGGRA
jgi:hypothetical protein